MTKPCASALGFCLQCQCRHSRSTQGPSYTRFSPVASRSKSIFAAHAAFFHTYSKLTTGVITEYPPLDNGETSGENKRMLWKGKWPERQSHAGASTRGGRGNPTNNVPGFGRPTGSAGASWRDMSLCSFKEFYQILFGSSPN